MHIQHEIKGDKLILTVDVSEAARKAASPSKSSGKTLVVATTGGFTRFADLSASLTVTVPNPEFKPAK